MSELINIYCDESCHLENDHQKVMVLGAIWCEQTKVKEVAARLKEIRARHALSSDLEIKWTKVGDKKSQFYMDLIDYFFDNDHLHFRGLVIPDKSILDHAAHQQTHDDWYYKMYFDLIKVIIDPEKTYRIYLDIKDTRSATKMSKLRDVLANAHYDFSREIIRDVISVRSEQVPLVQLADLLIGAVCYKNRLETDRDNAKNLTNLGKRKLIERISLRSGYSLTKTTLYKEQKFNLLIWKSGHGGN